MKFDRRSRALLGLSRTEAAILSALDTPKNLQEISEKAAVLRTSVAYNLKNLMRRGLVSKRPHGKRHVYSAISSHDLSKGLQSTIDRLILADSVRKGVRVKTTIEDEFVIHVGPKEIVPAFSRIATEIRGARVKAIQHHRSFVDLVNVASKKQVVEFNQAIIKNRIILDGILNAGAYDSYYQEIKADPAGHLAQIQSLAGRMSDYSVFPDDRFDTSSEIWIFQKTTLVISWRDKVAIEITNRNVTDLLREMFEYVKQGCQKIDHNLLMRQLIAKVQGTR